MDSSEKHISTSISINKKFIKNSENNLSSFIEKESSEEKINSALEYKMKVSKGGYCAAINCYNNRGANPNLSFFRFPKEEKRNRKWVINCKRKDLQNKTVAYLNRNCQLCARHFEDVMFMNSQKNKLVWDAVPTIFDVPNLPRTLSHIDHTTSQSQINDSSLKSTILERKNPESRIHPKRQKYDHPYPIMTLAKNVQNIDKSSCQQFEQHADHSANIEDTSNLACVEIVSEIGNQMDSENLESTSKADQKSMTEGEINLLMKQQEQLIKQQGQMLQVLQELKDIQKEILGLKRKNHELKLTKLRIAAQQAGIKVITKANK